MEPIKIEQTREAPVDKKAEKPMKQAPLAEIEQSAPLSPPSAVPSAPPPAAPPDRDEALMMVEGILSENIGEIYRQLSEARQRAFRKKGEEAAIKIKGLLKQAKIIVHEVLALIREWLKMLPQISSYFLEQEAKIKTDKILEMKREGQKIEK